MDKEKKIFVFGITAVEVYCPAFMYLGHGYPDVCCAEGFGLSIIVFLHGGVYDIYGHRQ